MAMRIGLSALGILLAVTAVAPRADAAPSYRYCAEYGYRGDMTCAYDTFEQCLATASGVGGSCRENPWWRPAPLAPARPRAKRKAV